MRARTNVAWSAPSRTFILITAACDARRYDHGDRDNRASPRISWRCGEPTSPEVDLDTPTPSRTQARSVRRCAPRGGKMSRSCRWTRAGGCDLTGRVASSAGFPRGSPRLEQLRTAGTVARLPSTGVDLAPDSVGALGSPLAARPFGDGAHEPDDVVGARKGHGPVRLTGRRGKRRLARVAPAGEGGLRDDRPRRPVSRTRS